MGNLSKTTSIVVSILAGISLIGGFVFKYGVESEVWTKWIILGPFLAVSLFLPWILIPFTIPEAKYKISGFGNGLVMGSIIAISLNAFNLFFIKTIFNLYPCTDFCGGDNILLGFLDIIYLLLGMAFIYIGKHKEELEDFDIDL